MGGINQQGDYKIDCRFNKEELKNRILAIAKHKKKIRLYKKDAVKLIDKIERESINENVIFYFDPPYYLKAESLYMNHYQFNNHKSVSDRIAQIKNINWVVSYDNNPNIQELYKSFNLKEYSFNHSAYQSRVGQEVLFFSPKLNQPKIENYNPIKFKLNKKNNVKEITYNF